MCTLLTRRHTKTQMDRLLSSVRLPMFTARVQKAVFSKTKLVHPIAIVTVTTSLLTQNTSVGLTEIALQTKSLSCIQKGADFAVTTYQNSPHQGRTFNRKARHNTASADAVKTDAIRTPPRSSRRRSRSPPVLNVHPHDEKNLTVVSTPSSSKLLLSYSLYSEKCATTEDMQEPNVYCRQSIAFQNGQLFKIVHNPLKFQAKTHWVYNDSQ